MNPTVSSAVVKNAAAANLPAAHVEPALFFRDVTLGPREAVLRFRLIYLWEARNPNTRTPIGQEMLLIDEEVKIREGGTDWGWGVVVNVVKKLQLEPLHIQGGGYIVDTLLHCSTGVSENGAKPKPCPPRPGEKGEMTNHMIYEMTLGSLHANRPVETYQAKRGVALINDTRYPFNALKERASRWKLCYKKAGRSSSSVQVRLLRFWEARNVRRGGELMGVDMLLLDSQATMVPATISVHRLETHRSNLKAGSVYTLKGFDVAQCNPNYRLSDSSLLIRFKDVTDPAIPIPPESFHFRNHSEMLGLANTNHQLQGKEANVVLNNSELRRRYFC
ncbi:hypothetical protein Bca101_027252 [Brassica carinata]